LIIAFHFVSGECRKLNANLHDTNRSGQWVVSDDDVGRGRKEYGNNHTKHHHHNNNKAARATLPHPEVLF